MMRIFYYLSVLGILIFSGCADKELTFDSLPDEAIVVKVNDEILTKRHILRFVALEKRQAAKLNGAERYEFENRIERDFSQFVPSFIRQRLLVQDAKKHAVLSAEDVDNRVESMIDALAKSHNMTREKFLNQDKDYEWFVRDSVEKRIWIDAHIASNIPPMVVVTPQMATNYLNLIEEETAAAKRTNDLIRAHLEEIRSDCLAGKAVFTNVAARIGCDDWDLGDREGMEFDTRSMRDAVFALKEGMISPVLESEDDYFIFYLAKVTPAQKNAEGVAIHPERRHAYQISLKKEDYPLQITYEQAYKYLAYQMQSQAVKNYVDDLMTNGVTRIEWPNGTNLFKRIVKGR